MVEMRQNSILITRLDLCYYNLSTECRLYPIQTHKRPISLSALLPFTNNTFFIISFYFLNVFKIRTHPRPMASTWDMSREGRKSLRNSAEKIPPFFMTLVFLMLRGLIRLGCFRTNPLHSKDKRAHYNVPGSGLGRKEYQVLFYIIL